MHFIHLSRHSRGVTVMVGGRGTRDPAVWFAERGPRNLARRLGLAFRGDVRLQDDACCVPQLQAGPTCLCGVWHAHVQGQTRELHEKGGLLLRPSLGGGIIARIWCDLGRIG